MDNYGASLRLLLLLDYIHNNQLLHMIYALEDYYFSGFRLLGYQTALSQAIKKQCQVPQVNLYCLYR